MKKCSICEGKKNAVEMSKAGWKKLRKVNGELSERYIRVYILCGEVRAYLEGYEAAEMKLDTECQELRYDERTCLIVCKRQGTWYIIDIWMENSEARWYEPVYLWRRVQKGCRDMIERVLIGWQAVKNMVMPTGRTS